MSQAAKPTVLTKTEQRRLRALVDEKGMASAAEGLGVGRDAITRALAGLELRRGTAALILAGLGK